MDGESCLISQPGRKHVLILPVILHAHFAGIFRLAVQLAKRGVTVTFVAIEKHITLLKTFDEVQDLGFNLVSYNDSGPAQTPGDNWTTSLFLASVRDLFQPIFNKLVKDQKAGIPGPTCIIGDRFLTWARDVANELNIPYYQFFSCGATFVRSLQACSKLFADGTLAMKEEPGGQRSLAEFEGLMKISGLPALRFGEMTNSNLGAEFVNSLGIAIGEADGVIVNTFYELEAPQIDAIRQSWMEDSRGKIPKLFLVGPLSNSATFKDRSFVEDSVSRGTDWLQWLAGRPPKSVVYVCVGTIVRFTPQQMKDLALALEATDQSFLWVIPRRSEGGLPPNFEARIGEKGLIVNEWVPQLPILMHSSIGGFVTHCGWNSIIESILSGVPMAAWPQMQTDQFINCRYIVDVLKIAVEVRPQDYSTGLQKPEELENAVRFLLSGEGNSLRSRIQELKKKAEAAVVDGGVSKKALNDLIQSFPT
ncbi:unnamed protein product [Calypogeia fissa]